MSSPLVADEPVRSGNPVFPGWYADPEGIVFEDQFWIYPTYSARYEEQLHFDAFTSPDLVHWTKHPRVLDNQAIPWAWRAMWAPSIIENNGRYFFFFAAIATGAGHHSVIQVPGRDEYSIVYHRRPLGETDGNHRVTCIDRMEFDEEGLIQPVVMTFEGVEAVRIKP